MRHRTPWWRRKDSLFSSPENRKRRTAKPKLEALEDRTVPAALLDFGDAPASYGTLLADNGARHELAGPMLGLLRDGEADGQPHSFAQGDDSNNVDDEDGVFAANLV